MSRPIMFNLSATKPPLPRREGSGEGFPRAVPLVRCANGKSAGAPGDDHQKPLVNPAPSTALIKGRRANSHQLKAFSAYGLRLTAHSQQLSPHSIRRRRRTTLSTL